MNWTDPLTVPGWRTRTVPFGSADGVLAGVLRPADIDNEPFVTGIEGTYALAIQASLVGQETSALLQPDKVYTLSFLGGISQFDSEYFFSVSLIAIDDSATLPFEGQPGVTRLALGSFFPPSNIPDGVMRRYEFSYTSPEVLPAHLIGTRVGISVFGSDGLPRVIYDDFDLSAIPVQDDCPADVNGDGVLTPTDFTAWINAFNNDLTECDQNIDGACTPTDFTAWIANFNAGC
ncbi:MAG: hypothetical protein F6K11_22665 [Leptolyngbya sp. SIO3F4]|nr:hypothetical protein [Leptolyngbya sp. SIO3F4]